MPTRKQPPEPSLRTILKEIRSQGVILASHDVALAELRAQGVRLEARMEGQGERLEEQIRSQGVRLEAHILSQGERFDEQLRSQGGRLETQIRSQGERFDQQLQSQTERLEAQILSQGVRLEAQIGSQAERFDGQLRSQGDRLEAQIRSQGIVLEEMRSQNRATIEAVEAARLALEQRIDRLEQETGARDLALELAIKGLQIDVKENTLSIRDLTARVEALQRLEDRVAALERRSS